MKIIRSSVNDRVYVLLDTPPENAIILNEHAFRAAAIAIDAGFPDNKPIDLIKLIHEASLGGDSHIGLKEAKDAVDAAVEEFRQGLAA